MAPYVVVELMHGGTDLWGGNRVDVASYKVIFTGQICSARLAQLVRAQV